MKKLIEEYLYWRTERAEEKRLGMPLGLSSGPIPSCALCASHKDRTN